MTKEQIIRSISEEFKISELESIQFYENVFQYIEGSFRKSKNLNISEFGKFNVIEKAGADGGKVNSVKFSPSKKLATEVNYNYNNLAKILFRDIERNINKERILSLGEENIYREHSGSESGEVFDRYTEEEKDFIEEQVNLTNSNYKNADLNDLEKRVRKIEAFINVIKKFFEDEKLGEAFPKAKTEIVPPQADYVKRVEEDKVKDEQYKASITALESKIKELEARFKEADTKKTEATVTSRTETKEEKIELPPIDVVPPVIEKKIEPAVKEEKSQPEAKIPDLGNLVVESDYVEVKTPESFIQPDFTVEEDSGKQVDESIAGTIEEKIEQTIEQSIAESVEPPVIEEKIEARIQEIIKETQRKPKQRDPSTSNIDDLLKTLGAPIEEEDVIEEEAIEQRGREEYKEEHKTEELPEEVKPEEVTAKFFIKTEENIPEVKEEKVSEKTEEKKLPDTPLVGDISDSELHQKVDSLIAEFRTESSKIKEEEEEEKRIAELPKEEAEPEVIKPIAPQDMEEAQLSTALSSIFNSILTSENIKKEEPRETPIIKEDVKNLHNEIVKSEKPSETTQPASEEKTDTAAPSASSSIGDIYSSAKSFNDIFESKGETKEEKEHRDEMQQIKDMHAKNESNGHDLQDTNGHGLQDTNGHGLKDTNGHNLKDTNGHGLQDTNGHGLKDANDNGPGLSETGAGDVRTSKIYTNGNPLKPYANGNGKNGNGASTLNQVLEDNGLQKESRTSIFIIIIIIVIALGLLFFAIFNSGIMGKENPSLKEKNYGLVKVKDSKSEKYFYDNGKDKVFFQTDKGFTIQAGSFKEKEAAIEKVKSMADKKIADIRIEELEKDNTTFYRVRIGMFTTLEEAKNHSEKF